MDQDCCGAPSSELWSLKDVWLMHQLPLLCLFLVPTCAPNPALSVGSPSLGAGKHLVSTYVMFSKYMWMPL